MTIALNGQRQDLADDSTITELLDQLNLHHEAVVVEINTAIVERSTYGAHQLSDGDRIEIIRFVGGC
jgi:thiamine biosynthesis protein ThiS